MICRRLSDLCAFVMIINLTSCMFLRWVFFLTCFCLVIRSQSSTNQGFSSSGIFTFTSTRLVNISSWRNTHGEPESLVLRESRLLLHIMDSYRSNTVNVCPPYVVCVHLANFRGVDLESDVPTHWTTCVKLKARQVILYGQ